MWVEENKTISIVIISLFRAGTITCWSLEMADEVVSEAWFATDKTDERRQLHVLLDYFEVFLPHALEPEAVADDDQHMIFPHRLLTLLH